MMDIIIFVVGFIVSIMVFWGLFMSLSLQFQRGNIEAETGNTKEI